MLIHKSYKTELDPNNKQITLLKQFAGCARFAWNWALAKEQEFYNKNLPFHHAKDLHIIWVVVKHNNKDLWWVQNIHSCIPRDVFRDLERAYKDFFSEKKNHPRFKKKKFGFGTFRINQKIKIDSNRVYVPKIGWIKIKESDYIPQKKCCYITISEKLGRWYVSVTFEENINSTPIAGPKIGVDLGIKILAITSENIIYENPKILSKYSIKLNRIHREVSRKKKGSNNWKKSVMKLGKVYQRIQNIRKDNINKITTSLTKTKSVIVVEDLRIRNMTIKNKTINKSLLDVGMYEFRRQLTYKTQWYGSKLVIAQRKYPSSKKCSRCGNIKKYLELNERIYHCFVCGLITDRDLNAAINLSKLADGLSESENACLRQEVAGSNIKILNPVPVDDSRIEHKPSSWIWVSSKEQA